MGLLKQDRTPAEGFTVPDRRLRLRRADTCCICRQAMAAGTEGWWDATARTVTCLPCLTAGPAVAVEVTDPVVSTPTPAPTPAPSPSGSAGASAARIGQRGHDRRKSRIREAHPHLGGVILALTEDPQHIRAWQRGAEGERRVGARLDALASESLVVLHDRRISGSRANIDHIVVGTSGVYVIDTKRYAGKLEVRDVGGWFRTDLRVYVGGRDGSKLLEGMRPQVAAVAAALGTGSELSVPPITPVLCFIDVELPWFAKVQRVGDVVVCWPAATAELVSRSGPLLPRAVASVAAELALGLPRA